MFAKLKSWLADDTLFIAVLLLLVAVGSFGMGRLSVLENSTFEQIEDSEIKIVQTEQVETSTTREGTEVVASKSGTRYHLPDCPGTKQIKETNLVRFASIELAEAAGYTPALNCSGLQ